LEGAGAGDWDALSDSNTARAPLGSTAEFAGDSNAAGAPPGSAAPDTLTAPGSESPLTAPVQPSRCEPFRAIILAKLEQGLSAQRIYQDLVRDHGFGAKYYSVRRFVQHLGQACPLPFRRMECAPGEQAQVDFGKGAPVIIPDGEALPVGVKARRRKTHVFRIVLSHSRKGYSEALWRQDTESFIRALENAFHHFGGVPKTLVPDNLKAAVIQADWFDPDLNPKIQSFCEHYHTTMLPTRPRTPRHKGKVERGVGYVQENGLKGLEFPSLQDENRHLLEWETSVADTRIHGTTRKQVGKVFEEVERPALQPLPLGRFPFFHEAERIVNRDGHVEVDKAFYSVPPEFVGRKVWARWDSGVVRIFDHRFQQIAFHSKGEPGRFRTRDEHIAPEKISGVERGAVWWLDRVGLIGPHARRWAEAMVQVRGIQGIRVLMGLHGLWHRHPTSAVEEACRIAQTHGAYRLRVIRKLIEHQGAPQEQFEFIDEHPIIRRLSDYGDLVRKAFQEVCL
jgi:transposase